MPRFVTIIIFGERYKSWISSLCSFLHPSYPSPLLGPIISASTQFSYLINLCFSLSVRDKVSHSHKGTGTIIFMWIQIICFVTPCRLAGKLPVAVDLYNPEDQNLQRYRCEDLKTLTILWILIFIFYFSVITKHLNFAEFSKDLWSSFMLWFCPALCWRDVNIFLRIYIYSIYTYARNYGHTLSGHLSSLCITPIAKYWRYLLPYAFTSGFVDRVDIQDSKYQGPEMSPRRVVWNTLRGLLQAVRLCRKLEPVLHLCDHNVC